MNEIEELLAWKVQNDRRDELVRRAYDAKFSIAQIAKTLGVVRDTVYRSLETTKGTEDKTAEENTGQDRAAAILRVQGNAYRDIGELLGITAAEARTAVLRAIQRAIEDKPGDEA